ncbi:MAG TPA: NEL-type E3 ubiquitin ligase domain-containing protein [Burkholderiales bacterium]|nr:NEL-type E3 ubiquitin ligase domain-containing protein [Burkholderiales bacterium]
MNTHDHESQMSDDELEKLKDEVRERTLRAGPESSLWTKWYHAILQSALDAPHGKAWGKRCQDAKQERDARQKIQDARQKAKEEGKPVEELTEDQELDRKEILDSWKYRAQALPLYLAIQREPYYLSRGDTPEIWKTFQNDTASDAYAVFLMRAPTMKDAGNPATQAKLRNLNEWLAQDSERRSFMFPRAVEALGACQNRLALALDTMEKDRINFEMAKLTSMAQILDKGLTELFYRDTLDMIAILDSTSKGFVREITEGLMAYLIEVGGKKLGMRNVPLENAQPDYFPLNIHDHKSALNIVKALETGNKADAFTELTPLLLSILDDAADIFNENNPEKSMERLRTLPGMLGPNVWKEMIRQNPVLYDVEALLKTFTPLIKARGQEAVEQMAKKNPDEVAASRVLRSLSNDFGPEALDALKSDSQGSFDVLTELMDQALEKYQSDHGDEVILLTAAEYIVRKVPQWGEKLMEQFPGEFQATQEHGKEEEKRIAASLEKVDQDLESLHKREDLPRLLQYKDLEAYNVAFEAWEKQSGYADKAKQKEDLLQQKHKQQTLLIKKIEKLKAELTQEYVNFRSEIKQQIPVAWFGKTASYELTPLNNRLLEKAVTAEQREKICTELREIEMGLLSDASKQSQGLIVKMSKDESSTKEKAREHWLRAQLAAVPVSRKKNDGGYEPSPEDYKMLLNRMIEKFSNLQDAEIKAIFSPVKVLDEATPSLPLGGARPIKTNDKTGKTLIVHALEGKRKPELTEVPTRELLAAIQTHEKNMQVDIIQGAPLPAGLIISLRDSTQQRSPHH